MFELFHALTCLPDAAIGLSHITKRGLAIILAVAIGIIGVSALHTKTDPEPIRPPASEVAEQKPERRIVKVLKWMWAKE